MLRCAILFVVCLFYDGLDADFAVAHGLETIYCFIDVSAVELVQNRTFGICENGEAGLAFQDVGDEKAIFRKSQVVEVADDTTGGQMVVVVAVVQW